MSSDPRHPTVADAARRAEVTLADGRTAFLLSVPGTRRRHGGRTYDGTGRRPRAAGTKARVALMDGSVLSVPVDNLTLTTTNPDTGEAS